MKTDDQEMKMCEEWCYICYKKKLERIKPSVLSPAAAAEDNEHSTCIHLKYIVSSSAHRNDDIYSLGQEEYPGNEGEIW